MFAFFANSNLCFSQNPSKNQDYIITKRLLSVEDGLPSRVVNEAVQDKQGFMWFATANGISRRDKLNNFWFSTPSGIEVILLLPETYLDIDTAVPLGLIVNELLTNSYKYAFVSEKNPRIAIDVKKIDEGCYQMVYRDNGVGVKEPLDFENAKTLGIKLIGGLAKQLSGAVVYSNDHGSVFTIDFKNTALRKSESS